MNIQSMYIAATVSVPKLNVTPVNTTVKRFCDDPLRGDLEADQGTPDFATMKQETVTLPPSCTGNHRQSDDLNLRRKALPVSKRPTEGGAPQRL